MLDRSSQNKKVEDWWHQNPFTYNGRLGVGKVPEKLQDLAFFERVERKIPQYCQYFTQIDYLTEDDCEFL